MAYLSGNKSSDKLRGSSIPIIQVENENGMKRIFSTPDVHLVASLVSGETTRVRRMHPSPFLAEFGVTKNEEAEMNDNLLETQVRILETIPIVDVRGELIGHTGPQLRQAIRDAASRSSQVLVNLCAVDSMDSSGLGMLLDMVKGGIPAGTSLHFCACSRRVQRLFEITNLDRVFDVHESEEEALAHAREVNAANTEGMLPASPPSAPQLDGAGNSSAAAYL